MVPKLGNFQSQISKLRPHPRPIKSQSLGMDTNLFLLVFFASSSSLLLRLFEVSTGHSDRLPGGSVGKESACNEGDVGDTGLIPGSVRSSGRGYGNPPQYSGLENPRAQRSPAGYSPWGRKELDMMSDFHFNLIQCCLRTNIH